MHCNAVVARLSRHAGETIHMEFGEQALPALRPGQVELALEAASINPLDLLMARGYGRRLFGLGAGGRLPLQLGRDGCGRVVAVGRDVPAALLGQRMWFALKPFHRGAWASRLCLPAAVLRPAPAGWSATALAAMPYAGLTALSLLEAAGLDETTSTGRRVFIHGASGGIGLALLSLLSAWGAELTASADPAVHAALQAHGRCRCVDSRGTALADAIAACDTLLNLVASAEPSWPDEARLLAWMAPQSRYVTPVTPLASLIDRHGLVAGLLHAAIYRGRARRDARRRGIDYRWAYVSVAPARLDRLAALLAAGALREPPIRCFGFRALDEALAAAARPPRLGKLVVEF